MKKLSFDIIYTICFPIKDDKVLMVKRAKKPWKGYWNGLGGHIEPGERATESVTRETLEETGIDLHQATHVKYKGIVTWNEDAPGQQMTDPNVPHMGMYAFIANLSDAQPLWTDERDTREGILAWLPIASVRDIHNKTIAHNVPYFFASMLASDTPQHYHCVFKNGALQEVQTLPLEKEFGMTVNN